MPKAWSCERKSTKQPHWTGIRTPLRIPGEMIAHTSLDILDVSTRRPDSTQSSLHV